MDVGVYFSRKTLLYRKTVFDAIAGVHDSVNASDGGELPLPDDALDVVRSQYDARELVRFLKARKHAPALWIVHEDLFAPEKNFVFGQALAKEAAVFSTRRLSSEESVAKEVAHEFGHLVGLRHCANRCVMEQSNTEADIKEKPGEFCLACKNMVETMLMHAKQKSPVQ